MTGKRVLIVGDFCRSSFGAQFYNTNFILQAGFIRAGCHVLTFSDRDTAREASIFRRKALGRDRMNRDLVETAKTYQPHLVMFGHADMTGAETIAGIRRVAPSARLAQFNVDALFRAKTMARFRYRAEHLDISFITTAAPERLGELAPRPGSVAYFPNPVDCGLMTTDLSLIAKTDIAYDGIFLGNGDERRELQVTTLIGCLPDDFRFFAGGSIFGTPRLTGHRFLDTLATGAMSPNLPLDDTVPVEFLYSSDRIAQLLGLGIVALCQAGAGLDALYEDGVVLYASIEDLAEQMAALADDDALRRRIAAKGRRIASERTSAERVAAYMLDMTLGDGPSTDYGWPSDLI